MSYIHCNPITTVRLRVHEANRIVPPCVRSSECRHGMRTVRVFGRSRTAASPTIIRCRKFRTAPNRSRARQKAVTADLPVAYVPASMSAIPLVSENLPPPTSNLRAAHRLPGRNSEAKTQQDGLRNSRFRSATGKTIPLRRRRRPAFSQSSESADFTDLRRESPPKDVLRSLLSVNV